MLSQGIQQSWQVTINPDSKHVTEPIRGISSVVKGSANNDSHHIIVQLTSQLNAKNVLEDHLRICATTDLCNSDQVLTDPQTPSCMTCHSFHAVGD